MPLYQFKHKETGEIIDKFLRLSEHSQWKIDNPDYEGYMGKPPGLISGTKSAQTIAGDGWNDHLNNIKANSGRDNTIKTK